MRRVKITILDTNGQVHAWIDTSGSPVYVGNGQPAPSGAYGVIIKAELVLDAPASEVAGAAG